MTSDRGDKAKGTAKGLRVACLASLMSHNAPPN